MLLSVEATLVGGLLRLFSQYRTDRGWHPTARARSACVSPASIRAARIWRPETMLLITRLYIRFCKRRHRSSRFIESRPGHPLSDGPCWLACLECWRSLAVVGQLAGMRAEQGCDLGLDRLRQQRSHGLLRRIGQVG